MIYLAENTTFVTKKASIKEHTAYRDLKGWTEISRLTRSTAPAKLDNSWLSST